MQVLALVLAGGAGNRLEVLTKVRAEPAMPFAGVYRLIDFPLSNCMHAGISDVWIAQQYHPQSLNDHVSNGRPWDLDRTHGGLRLLPPHQGPGDEGGWAQGNADVIYRNRRFISEAAPEVLLVMSADHVYKLDFSKVVTAHLERDVDATMVTTRVPMDHAVRLGMVKTTRNGLIESYDYKPDDPSSDLAATEVFAFSTGPLMSMLQELCKTENELSDLGDELLPRLVSEGRAAEYRLEGYWRDVGTPVSYHDAHMDLLADDVGLDLDDPAWPIFTLAQQRPPAHIHPEALNLNSLVSPGCAIRGTVEHSVLGPGVTVEKGAVVRDAVVLHDCHIGRDAAVLHAIVDERVEVEMGATVGASEGELALVGRGVRVRNGMDVPAAASVAPDTVI
ncbi:MAG: glucose-1-phosphate adenylyltransferase family protein [Actinomycetota bacterium]